MSILVAIFLPIVGGLALFLRHELAEKQRRIYLEVVCLITTAFVWYAILWGNHQVFTLYRFTTGFSVDFGVDGMSSLFAGMVSLMWPLVMLYSFSYMEKEEEWKNSFFAFYLMTYGVTLGVAFSADILTLYVFFELLTLVTLPLVLHYRDHESMYAARSYACYLIGGAALAFLPVILVTLNGNEGVFAYGGSLTQALDAGMLRWVYLFGFFGFGAKAAIFPLHLWLPRAGVAPTPVTALLHAVAVVNSGVFAVARLTYYSIGTEVLFGSWVQTVVMAFSCFTLLYGAVLAIRERHFKRRLAFSTVSNLSYMLSGLCVMTPLGLEAGMSHMLFHGIIKMTLFLCAGAFMTQTGNAYLFELEGVGRRMPKTFLIYFFAGLSLVGIPLNCGFISKWRLFEAGASLHSGLGYLMIFSLILATLLCAIYTLTPCVRAFFPEKGRDLYLESKAVEAPGLMLWPMLAFLIVNFVFGCFPGGIMSLLGKISQGLF